jgi:hypothetical protein
VKKSARVHRFEFELRISAKSEVCLSGASQRTGNSTESSVSFSVSTKIYSGSVEVRKSIHHMCYVHRNIYQGKLSTAASQSTPSESICFQYFTYSSCLASSSSFLFCAHGFCTCLTRLEAGP